MAKQVFLWGLARGKLKADRHPRHIPHQEISPQIIMIFKSQPGMMTTRILTTPLRLIFKNWFLGGQE